MSQQAEPIVKIDHVGVGCVEQTDLDGSRLAHQHSAGLSDQVGATTDTGPYQYIAADRAFAAAGIATPRQQACVGSQHLPGTEHQSDPLLGVGVEHLDLALQTARMQQVIVRQKLEVVS